MDRHIKTRECAFAAGRSSSSAVVSKVLQTHLHRKEEAARTRVAKQQARSRTIRRAAAAVRVRNRKAKAAKAKEKKEKEEVAAKLDALPKTFSAKECGLETAEGLRARVRCLERLKLRSPKLSFEDDARWPEVRDTYCKKFRRVHKIWEKLNIGGAFIEEINAVLAELVEHYKGSTTYNKGGKVGGDPAAFQKYFAKMASSLPKPSTAAVF